MLATLILLNALVQVGLIVAIWSTLDAFVAGQYYQERILLVKAPFASLPSTAYTLLTFWLTCLALWLVPRLTFIFWWIKRTLITTSASKGKKQQTTIRSISTTKPTRFNAFIFLLLCWFKLICVVYLAWYGITQSLDLEKQVTKLSYSTPASTSTSGSNNEWKQAQSALTQMYLIFTYTIVAAILIYFDQNSAFFRLGQAFVEGE